MKIINEVEANTYLFSELEEGCTYRETIDGPIYMKVQPVKDQYNAVWNCVGIENGERDYTFEDADVYLVDGTFVEGYKKG